VKDSEQLCCVLQLAGWSPGQTRRRPEQVAHMQPAVSEAENDGSSQLVAPPPPPYPAERRGNDCPTSSDRFDRATLLQVAVVLLDLKSEDACIRHELLGEVVGHEERQLKAVNDVEYVARRKGFYECGHSNCWR
jgi:hypothetical protein